MANDAVVGIDLGTTNSSVAAVIDGTAQVLTENDDGLVPSCVGLDGDGRVIVGRTARNQAVVFPERTVLSVKRRMGTTERIRMGSGEYLPEEISAFILKDLAERAERVLDRQVSRAVITVPAYFTDAQRKATREAGRIAGLEVVRIINEPTAAALAYDATSSEHAKILVYDLGGGTFDVSVVASESGVIEVLATAGDNRLGGDDFDRTIVERLNKHLETRYPGGAFRDNRSVQARLLHASEAAKRELSSAPFAVIEEDSLARSRLRTANLSYELSRLDFEGDIEERLRSSLDGMARAMQDAKVQGSDLQRVLLVGGSTRIPMVARLLRERLGMTPHGEIDPDRCVALGAAIQGGIESGEGSGSVLVDVTPYTFGTRVVGELEGVPSNNVYAPIIPRNSKLPVKKSEVFVTLTPNQPTCRVDVFQGEDPDVRKNTALGDFLFEGLNENAAAYEEGMVFTLSLGVDGILDVTARERVTGREITGRIEDALGARSEDEEESGSPEDESGDSTEILLARAKAALKTVSNEDRAELRGMIMALKKASRSGDPEEVGRVAGEISEFLYFVE